ncbi:hypothetical protein DXG01_016449 [Tephrocybe rancida]|nr:hypothetical protein DXG01_016449 [Tephrocybe rancida]
MVASKIVETFIHPGEGGSFALFQGMFPPADKDYDADRTLTGESFSSSLSENRGKRHINKAFRPLDHIVRLTMADGIFTPAVSVTSAVGGIAVAKASVTKDIIPISIVRTDFPCYDIYVNWCWTGNSFGVVRGTKIRHIEHWIYLRPEYVLPTSISHPSD